MYTYYRNKSWLENHYYDLHMSLKEIADICMVTPMTILKWMDKFNLPRREIKDSNKGIYNGSWVENPIKNRDLLIQEYISNKLTFREIAKKYETSLRTVARYIHSFNIPIDEKIVKENIIKNRLKAIVYYCECGNVKCKESINCVTCYINILKTRFKNKEIINCNYTKILRDYTRGEWANSVINRDEFCQICNSNKELHAHHIAPFAFIKNRIILENANLLDLSNDGGIIQLIEIAKDDFRINDISNGITLCKKCHVLEHKKIKRYEEYEIYYYNAKILKVLDGDSLHVEFDLGFGIYKKETIRLYGIDAIELSDSDINRKGKALTTKYILSEILQIGETYHFRTYKNNDRGKYGRYLAVLILSNQDINKFLVDTGLVRDYYF